MMVTIACVGNQYLPVIVRSFQGTVNDEDRRVAIVIKIWSFHWSMFFQQEGC